MRCTYVSSGGFLPFYTSLCGILAATLCLALDGCPENNQYRDANNQCVRCSNTTFLNSSTSRCDPCGPHNYNPTFKLDVCPIKINNSDIILKTTTTTSLPSTTSKILITLTNIVKTRSSTSDTPNMKTTASKPTLLPTSPMVTTDYTKVEETTSVTSHTDTWAWLGPLLATIVLIICAVLKCNYPALRQWFCSLKRESSPQQPSAQPMLQQTPVENGNNTVGNSQC